MPPVEAEQQGRCELGHGAERQVADARQAGEIPEPEIEHPGRQQDQQYGAPAHLQQQPHQPFIPPLLPEAAQQHRQHQIVADHDGQGYGADDHHAGGRRGAAEKRQHRHAVEAERHRQADDIGIRGHVGPHPLLARQRQRPDEEPHQEQVEREQPARPVQILALVVLHHSHVELARQADDGAHGHQGIDGELQQAARRHRHHRIEKVPGHQGAGLARPGDDEPEREAPHRHEGEQLDHGLEGDGDHHAAMVLGGVQVAGAEQYAEQGQQQGDAEGQLGRVARGPRRHRVGHQQIQPGDDGLELQHQVGKYPHDGDQADHHGQTLGLAIAGGDEVGDGGDVLALGHQDEAGQQAPAKQEHQHGAKIDGHRRPGGFARLPDGAEEGPGGAIDGERQAVEQGLALEPTALALVRHIGDEEQQAQIGERQPDQQPSLVHLHSSLVQMC
ncbi:hypothetical protein D3C78_769200 [compost metagenome]